MGEGRGRVGNASDELARVVERGRLRGVIVGTSKGRFCRLCWLSCSGSGGSCGARSLEGAMTSYAQLIFVDVFHIVLRLNIIKAIYAVLGLIFTEVATSASSKRWQKYAKAVLNSMKLSGGKSNAKMKPEYMYF